MATNISGGFKGSSSGNTNYWGYLKYAAVLNSNSTISITLTGYLQSASTWDIQSTAEKSGSMTCGDETYDTTFSWNTASEDNIGGYSYNKPAFSHTFTVPASTRTVTVSFTADCNLDISPGGYLYSVSASGTIDLSSLIQKPVIGNLKNTNPYETNQSVSAAETSISLSWGLTSGDAATKSQYQIDNGSWIDCTSIYKTDITGLSAGVTYKINIRSYNDAGWSDTISITVRTLYEKPVVEFSHVHDNDAGLEDVNINWKSNIDLQSIIYSINNSDEVIINVEGTSGSFIISSIPGSERAGLYPSTEYEVVVTGKSTNDYDHRESERSTINTTTDAIATLVSSPNYIFGDPLQIQKENESGNTNILYISVKGRHNITPIGTAHILHNLFESLTPINFTDSELDTMYKEFNTTNTIDITLTINTKSLYRPTDDYKSEYTGILTLTGNAKTAHYNDGDDPLRGKVWYNDNGVLRRGVVWYNDNGTIRRCI